MQAHTHPRQRVSANTQEQQRQVEEAAQGLTQHLSAFPASERHSLRAPRPRGPSASRRLAARLRAARSAFVWPGWEPRPPASPAPLRSGSFSTPITRRGLAAVGVSPGPLPSQFRALFKRNSGFAGFSHPARQTRGQGWGLEEDKRKGHTKPG